MFFRPPIIALCLLVTFSVVLAQTNINTNQIPSLKKGGDYNLQDRNQPNCALGCTRAIPSFSHSVKKYNGAQTYRVRDGIGGGPTSRIIRYDSTPPSCSVDPRPYGNNGFLADWNSWYNFPLYAIAYCSDSLSGCKKITDFFQISLNRGVASFLPEDNVENVGNCASPPAKIDRLDPILSPISCTSGSKSYNPYNPVFTNKLISCRLPLRDAEPNSHNGRSGLKTLQLQVSGKQFTQRFLPGFGLTGSGNSFTANLGSQEQVPSTNLALSVNKDTKELYNNITFTLTDWAANEDQISRPQFGFFVDFTKPKNTLSCRTTQGNGLYPSSRDYRDGWTNGNVSCTYTVSDPNPTISSNLQDYGLIRLTDPNNNTLKEVFTGSSKPNKIDLIRSFTNPQEKIYDYFFDVTDIAENRASGNSALLVRIDKTPPAVGDVSIKQSGSPSGRINESGENFPAIILVTDAANANTIEADDTFALTMDITDQGTSPSGVYWNATKIKIERDGVLIWNFDGTPNADKRPNFMDNLPPGVSFNVQTKTISFAPQAPYFSKVGLYKISFQWEDSAGNKVNRAYYLRVLSSEANNNFSVLKYDCTNNPYANNSDLCGATIALRDRFQNLIDNRDTDNWFENQELDGNQDAAAAPDQALRNSAHFYPRVSKVEDNHEILGLSYAGFSEANFKISSQVPTMSDVSEDGNKQENIPRALPIIVRSPKVLSTGIISTNETIEISLTDEAFFAAPVNVVKPVVPLQSQAVADIFPEELDADISSEESGGGFDIFPLGAAYSFAPSIDTLKRFLRMSLSRPPGNQIENYVNQLTSLPYTISNDNIVIADATPDDGSACSLYFGTRYKTCILSDYTHYHKPYYTEMTLDSDAFEKVRFSNGNVFVYGAGENGWRCSSFTPTVAPGVAEIEDEVSVGIGMRISLIDTDDNNRRESFFSSTSTNCKIKDDEPRADIEGNVQAGLESVALAGGESRHNSLVSDNVATDVRQSITERAYSLIRGITSVNPNVLPNDWLQNLKGEEVTVVKGNLTISGPINISGGFLTKKTHTIIVIDGNLLITDDLSYGAHISKSSLGVILLNSDLTESGFAKDDDDRKVGYKNGNIFIDNDVQRVVGTYYADGSLVSVNNNYYEINNTGIVPSDWDDLDDTKLNKQLVLEGFLFSRNTLGGALKVNEEEQFYTPWGNTEGMYGENIAKKFDFHYTRRHKPSDSSTCSPGHQLGCDLNPNSFVIRLDGKVKTLTPPGFDIGSSFRLR